MMKAATLTRGWFTLAALLAAPLLIALSGCGGDYDIGEEYDYAPPGYPEYKNLVIVLRVVDPYGNPVGGATVTVAGNDDSRLTSDFLRALGEGYPRQWRGWLANWTKDRYRAVINYPGDVRDFTIRVGKRGYWSDETNVRILSHEPSEIFVRDVMVLAPRPTLYSAQAPEKEPRYAEITPADPDFVREPSDDPPITIGEE